MSAAFTPGPWLNEQGSHQIIAKALRDDFGKVVGKKNIIARAAISTQGGSEVELANARLIAAAPELYEALKAITDCYGVGYKSADDLARALAVYMTDARAILAKVRP